MSESFEWGSRRGGGLRHAVSVPAHIIGKNGIPIKAEIRNISSTGMFLGYDLVVPLGGPEPLKIDTNINVIFAPDGKSSPDESITIAGKIMRRQAHGIGIRFIDLSPEHMSAVRALAIAAVEGEDTAERKEAERIAEKQTSEEIDRTKITRHVRKVLERQLPSMIFALRSELSKRLRAIDDEGAGAADADLLDQKASALGRAIERRVMLSFAELGSLDSTQQLLMRSPAAVVGDQTTNLGLMGQARAENSPGLAATITQVEALVQRKSFEINVRMADVLGRRVDDQENPLVPAVLCSMLWYSTLEYCDTPRVQRHLQESIKRRIAPLLSDLYDDLETTLNEHGVRRALE